MAVDDNLAKRWDIFDYDKSWSDLHGFSNSDVLSAWQYPSWRCWYCRAWVIPNREFEFSLIYFHRQLRTWWEFSVKLVNFFWVILHFRDGNESTTFIVQFEYWVLSYCHCLSVYLGKINYETQYSETTMSHKLCSSFCTL